MNECPKEIIGVICYYLDPEELCALSMTCKRLNEISKDDRFWSHHCGEKLLGGANISKERRHKEVYIQYYRDMFSEVKNCQLVSNPSSSNEYDYIFKFLFVGMGTVGKRSIITRIVDGTMEQYPSYVFIDFRIKVVELYGTKIKLQLWHSSGRERYRTITNSYYRNSKVVFVTFSVTDRYSFDTAKHMHEDVKRANIAESGVLFVVGNKSDLVNEREVSASEGEEFAAKNGGTYFEISAQNWRWSGRNVPKGSLDGS